MIFTALFYVLINVKAHVAVVEPKDAFGFIVAFFALNIASLDNTSSSEEIIKEPKKSFLQKLEL